MQRRRGATYLTAGKTDCTKVESNPERLGTKPNVITIRPVDDMKQYENLDYLNYTEHQNTAQKLQGMKEIF